MTDTDLSLKSDPFNADQIRRTNQNNPFVIFLSVESTLNGYFSLTEFSRKNQRNIPEFCQLKKIEKFHSTRSCAVGGFLLKWGKFPTCQRCHWQVGNLPRCRPTKSTVKLETCPTAAPPSQLRKSYQQLFQLTPIALESVPGCFQIVSCMRPRCSVPLRAGTHHGCRFAMRFPLLFLSSHRSHRGPVA